MSEINTNSSLVSTTLNSFWNTSTDESNNNSNSSSSISNMSTSTAQLMNQINNSYGINYVNNLAYAAEAAFIGLGLGDGDRVTFTQIQDYTDTLKNEFAETVAEGLAELGVSEDAEYQIVSNYDGEGVIIVSDSEDKAKIEQYFRDNPKMVEQFEQIQYLDNVNATRTKEQIQANLQISKIQLQSMSGLFSSSPSSSIMSSGSGSTYFGQGFSAIV